MTSFQKRHNQKEYMFQTSSMAKLTWIDLGRRLHRKFWPWAVELRRIEKDVGANLSFRGVRLMLPWQSQLEGPKDPGRCRHQDRSTS